MMLASVLRFDAPWISFGGVIVDHHGFTERFPGRSLLAGLLGNALGLDHSATGSLQELQDRLSYAARWDAPPVTAIEYQTVDLGQRRMMTKGWTTRGHVDERKGGTAAKGTHQRHRHYLEDGLLTVVLHLAEGGRPRTTDIPHLLQHPRRPLFLGRKDCLPARPLVDPERPVVEADSLAAALLAVPPWHRDGTPSHLRRFPACWPEGEGPSPVPGARGEPRLVFDGREWASQLPAGSSFRYEGYLVLEGR